MKLAIFCALLGSAAAACYEEPSCGCLNGGAERCGSAVGETAWCYVSSSCSGATWGVSGYYQYCREVSCSVPACKTCTSGYAAMANLNGGAIYGCCMAYGPITCNVWYLRTAQTINAQVNSDLNKPEGCSCEKSGRGTCLANPTRYPTNFPVEIPTRYPTNFPVEIPTRYPTNFPVEIPTPMYTPPSPVYTPSPVSSPNPTPIGFVSSAEYDCGVIYVTDKTQCEDAEQICIGNGNGKLTNAKFDGKTGTFQCESCSKGLFVAPKYPEPTKYTWFAFVMVGVGAVCLAVVFVLRMSLSNQSIWQDLRNASHSGPTTCMADHDLFAIFCLGGPFNGVKVLQALLLSFALTIIFQADRIAEMFVMTCTYVSCTGQCSAVASATSVFSVWDLLTDGLTVLSLQTVYDITRAISDFLAKSTRSKRDDYYLFGFDCSLTIAAGFVSYLSIADLSDITGEPVSKYFIKYGSVFLTILLLKWIFLQPFLYFLKKWFLSSCLGQQSKHSNHGQFVSTVNPVGPGYTKEDDA